MELRCQKCGEAFKSGDDITRSLTNSSDGLRTVWQFWHQACWQPRALKAFADWACGNV